jgi:hypothetical protein
MAAGLWFAGPVAASVPAPRLQVAEAQVAAAQAADTDEPAPVEPVDTSGVAPATATAPVVGSIVAVPAAVPLSIAGPRAPPHS